MKKYTVEQIAEYLTQNTSFEPDDDYTGAYYVHISENGELIDHFESYDRTFVEKFDIEKYVGHETSDADDIYDKETLEDADFHEICEKLKAQVNEYLEDFAD